METEGDGQVQSEEGTGFLVLNLCKEKTSKAAIKKAVPADFTLLVVAN